METVYFYVLCSQQNCNIDIPFFTRQLISFPTTVTCNLYGILSSYVNPRALLQLCHIKFYCTVYRSVSAMHLSILTTLFNNKHAYYHSLQYIFSEDQDLS